MGENCAVAGLTLATGLVALTAGCKGVDIYIVPKDPDASQTEPNKDLTDPEQKDPETPNTPAQPSTPTEPDYSMYSQLLQDVLNSDYYNDLIAKFKIGELPSKGHADVGNLIDDIPYNFLENQGEDIDAIKYNEYHERMAKCFY